MATLSAGGTVVAVAHAASRAADRRALYSDGSDWRRHAANSVVITAAPVPDAADGGYAAAEQAPDSAGLLAGAHALRETPRSGCSIREIRRADIFARSVIATNEGLALKKEIESAPGGAFDCALGGRISMEMDLDNNEGSRTITGWLLTGRLGSSSAALEAFRLNATAPSAGPATATGPLANDRGL